ncbi:MAG: hypothetical protein WBO36_14990, partial [Saprospiraceae bacterium]
FQLWFYFSTPDISIFGFIKNTDFSTDKAPDDSECFLRYLFEGFKQIIGQVSRSLPLFSFVLSIY